MGKGTNFSGQPVLSQLIKLMDRQKINTLASKSGANYYTKHLDGYSHLVVMLYAVLSNLRSLREVCLGFAANATRMNHLGIDHMNAKFKIIEQRKCPEKDIIADQIIEFTYDKYVERPLTEEELSHRRGRRPKSGVVTVKERVQGTYRCRRIVRRTDDGKDTIEFITNVLDPEEMSAEQVCETYRRRWTIESLFKRLKQNFPLKYFLGDNVNAIEIQIWVTMIAYLLLRVMQTKSMSKLAFSNIVMLTRVTLGAYIDIITLLNCPKLDWNLIEQQRARWVMNQNIRQLDLFDTQEGLLLDTRT